MGTLNYTTAAAECWGYFYYSPIKLADFDYSYGSDFNNEYSYSSFPDGIDRLKVSLSYSFVNADNDRSNESLEVHSVPESLKNIKNSLGLSMTNLASLFGVTRPTIYSYINDSSKKPGSGFEKKLHFIEMLVSKMKEKEIRMPNTSILYRRDSKGDSLKQAIIKGVVTESMIDRFVRKEFEIQTDNYLFYKKHLSDKSLSNEEVSSLLYPLED